MPERTAVYLIDPDGYARWIPNRLTYNNLFLDGEGILHDASLAEIAQHFPLSSGACLAQGDITEEVYLVDQGVRRWIARPKVMAKYHFNPKKVVVVPQVVINAVPAGRIWT
jgi:hypothetical protein